jgi:hypothetical protein
VKPDRRQALISIVIQVDDATYYTVGMLVFRVKFVGTGFVGPGLRDIDFVIVLHLQEILFKHKNLLVNEFLEIRQFFTL